MFIEFEKYIEGVVSGDRRFLAKTITLIESTVPAHHEISKKIIHSLLPNAGNSIRIGVTGIPGVGKSTFINNFGLMLAEKNYTIAVLAIDPSSNISGGSIMGDKTRMEHLSTHPNAFVRPSPSGGTLGGVTRTTREITVVCEAAGFDIIIIETVGVGQSEIKVASMVDFFLVLLLSNAGDELQGIKKGILELADALVINKADGNNILKAKQAKRIYENAMQILTPLSSNWSPPVLTCSSTTSFGLKKIWDQIISHHKKLSKTGELLKKRRNQSIDWMWAIINDGIQNYFLNQPEVKLKLSKITKSVKNDLISPTTGAEELLSLLSKYKNVRKEEP